MIWKHTWGYSVRKLWGQNISVSLFHFLGQCGEHVRTVWGTCEDSGETIGREASVRNLWPHTFLTHSSHCPHMFPLKRNMWGQCEECVRNLGPHSVLTCYLSMGTCEDIVTAWGTLCGTCEEPVRNIYEDYTEALLMKVGFWLGGVTPHPGMDNIRLFYKKKKILWPPLRSPQMWFLAENGLILGYLWAICGDLRGGHRKKTFFIKVFI